MAASRPRHCGVAGLAPGGAEVLEAADALDVLDAVNAAGAGAARDAGGVMMEGDCRRCR